ncbi:MAG: hypothetical protein LBU70_10640 [Chitinispirillales bacterium]|jgi:hypothetical protein|nr:hypothetical protein [Chitinispirillales bacterium]
MFAFSKKLKFTVAAVAATAAFIMVSCGGKKVNDPESPASAAARGGFVTITTPFDELESIKHKLEEENNIPCGLGIGESNNQGIARTISADDARAKLATSIGTQVQRLMESYAQNVNNQAKQIWEEGVRQLTNEHLRGARPFKTVTQFNQETGVYQVYTLMILDPAIFRAAVADAVDRAEEFELRVKKDDMMAKLDAGIALYDAQYRGR